MGARITVEGIEEFEAALKGLPYTVRKDVLTKAIADAAVIVREAIQARANFGPYSTGRLKASVRFQPSQIAGEPSGFVAPSRKKGAGGRHAHLVERGTRPHGNNHPGQAAQPFFVPGVEASKEAALNTMSEAILARAQAYWDSGGGA